MSSFFHQQTQIMMGKHIDSYPLLKINRLLDWQPVEQLLNRQKILYIRDHWGHPAYPLLPMLKAVLLGQWYSLSDPELERCLATRLDFYFFCGFDDIALPDHSTFCRFCNWLAQDGTLTGLLEL
ncbi:transposase, partial [Neisseria dentiae]